MWNTQDTQKTLEVKIRPYSNQTNAERPDQKGVSRVHLCKEALFELQLEAGQPCFLWKSGNEDQKREAIVWPTAEKSLSKKVIQMSKTFQEACGFKLGDDLNISAAGGAVDVADVIILRDVTAEAVDAALELSSQDRPYWEWFLRESLGRWNIHFGVQFNKRQNFGSLTSSAHKET
jgi:AAA family ATPase